MGLAESNRAPVWAVGLSELSEESFAAFGRVVHSGAPGFATVFIPPEAEAWQIGVNNVSASRIDSLHRHPRTWECFAPTRGDLYIVVADAGLDPAGDPVAVQRSVRVFRVTQPVCVAPMVWHTLISPDSASAFVCENASVTGELVPLPQPLEIDW